MGMMGPAKVGNDPGNGTVCQGCLHFFDCSKLEKFKKSGVTTDLCNSAQERLKSAPEDAEFRPVPGGLYATRKDSAPDA